jgi:DNA-binding NarL/FixJ family response regulator
MRLRTLIVDDQASFCSWAAELLETQGFEVVGQANDGASAVEMARELRPDVVLLDVQLPDLDGFEVAQLLALNREPPAVVLISAREASDYGRRIREAPARGFLSKADLSGPAVAALIGQHT